MACSRASILLFLLLVMSLSAIFPSGAKASVSCSQVVKALTPCLPYLKSDGRPAVGFCSEIKTLYRMVPTAAERQGVCSCLKEAITSIHYRGNNVRFSAWLPAKCGVTGVNIPYKINPSTNCKSIK